MPKEDFITHVKELNSFQEQAFNLERCLGNIPIATEGFVGEILDLCGNLILEAVLPDGISGRDYELFWNSIINESLTEQDIADLFEELTANG